MPDNPRIVPVTIPSCSQTDAFLQAPGKEFWESPGRVRRSGAVIQPLSVRRVDAGRKVFGAQSQLMFGPSDQNISYSPYADIYEYHFTRYLNHRREWHYDDWGNLEQSSAIGINGVPSNTVAYWSNPDPDGTPGQISWCFSTPSFIASWYHAYFPVFVPSVLLITQTSYYAGYPHLKNWTVNETLSNPWTAQDVWVQCKSVCDTHILSSWVTHPTGSFTLYGTKDFLFANLYTGTDYSGGDFSAYTGEWFILQGGQGLIGGPTTALSGWQLNLTPAGGTPSVSVCRSDFRMSPTDPRPNRTLTIVEEVVYLNGQRFVSNIGSVTLTPGQEHFLAVPEWMPNPVISRKVYAI